MRYAAISAVWMSVSPTSPSPGPHPEDAHSAPRQPKWGKGSAPAIVASAAIVSSPCAQHALLRRTAPTCRPHTLSSDRAGGLPSDVFERVDWSLCSHAIHADKLHTVPTLSLSQPSSRLSYAADAGWRRAQWRAASTRGPPKSPPITRDFITAVAERLVEHTQAPSRPSRLPQNVPHTRSKYGPRRSPPALALAQHL
jgi:hypothetical protein